MRDHKKSVLGMVLAIFISLLIILGCSEKKSTASKETDESAILSLITSYPDIFKSCVLDTIPDTTIFGKIHEVTEDTVRFWWRWIKWSQTKRSIDIYVYPPDTVHEYRYADVSITDSLWGNLYVFRKDTMGGWYPYVKPTVDIATRSAYFERKDPVDSPHRGWRLIQVSGLLIESSPSTREIDSVHVRTSKSNYDTTITLSYINDCRELEDLFTFGLDDTVTLTVFTTDPADSVYLHAYSHLFPLLSHVRRNFFNNGDGSFSGSWVTTSSIADTVAYRHAAIDVLKHSTLDGDDGYDSQIWGVIYRIKDF
jgi:hypothetical protein